MNRSIEQALLSLMPTHGDALPAGLVDLASSLLAQSRHTASALKADEEIARLYACAHIACDRLKVSLDLPPIEPRPPIPPRIYKKLYNHLDTVLPNTPQKRTASGRVRTPSSKLRDLQNESPSNSKSLPSRGTPSKERSLAQFRNSVVGDPGTPTKSTGRAKAATAKTGLQPWIHPTVRFMCSQTDNARLAPTLLAGMETIAAPGGRRTRDEWVADHAADLLAALYFFVTMQVRRLRDGGLIDEASYPPARREVRTLIRRARQEVDTKRMDEEEFWDGFAEPRNRDFDLAVQRVTSSGWLESDWFRAVKELHGPAGGDVGEGEGADGDGNEDREDMDEGTGGKGLVPVRRADTMFQERYDYLSDARREEFRVWKSEVMRRIEQAENTAMQVD